MSSKNIEIKERFENKNEFIIYTGLFFFIASVYLISFFMMYPLMPVVERQAENIESYRLNYPPLRADEYTYYTIAENFLSGSPYRNGSPEINYPSGFPLAAVPFVAIFGVMGIYIANILIMIACSLIFFLIVRKFGSIWFSSILTLIFSFATLNWFYALSGFSEPLSQLLVLISFYLILFNKDFKKGNILLLIAGIAVSLNLLVRPHYILISVPLAIYLLAESKKGKGKDYSGAIYFIAGCALTSVIWFIRNYIIFGGPFTFEYSRMVTSYVPGARSSYMTGNIFLGIHRLLFDEYHGLFTITPVLLLFPAGLRGMWQKGLKRESILILVIITIMALFAASGPYPFTEFSLGSRHLLPVMPLMLFPAVFFVDRSFYTRSLIAILAVYSFYQAGFGWFTGGEPGMGFFLGILNDAQSKAIILARKGMVPHKEFKSQQDIVDAYLKALKKANLMDLFQTLNPAVLEKIIGNERTFMMYLRNQTDPTKFIQTADPQTGIMIKSFTISGGGTNINTGTQNPGETGQ